MKMGLPAMKVHQFARGPWENEPTSLTLGCKRLRPLAPKLVSATTTTSKVDTFDLKSFIRPDSGHRKPGSSDFQREECTHQAGGRGGIRLQEQIGILEMLYRGGMRTPNAQQIEQITAQLGNYGKIEGKNVFYWFQNHKARERQKQKCVSLGLNHTHRTCPNPLQGHGLEEELDCTSHKRKCKSWTFEQCLGKNIRCCDDNEDEQGAK